MWVIQKPHVWPVIKEEWTTQPFVCCVTLSVEKESGKRRLGISKETKMKISRLQVERASCLCVHCVQRYQTGWLFLSFYYVPEPKKWKKNQQISVQIKWLVLWHKIKGAAVFGHDCVHFYLKQFFFFFRIFLKIFFLFRYLY